MSGADLNISPNIYLCLLTLAMLSGILHLTPFRFSESSWNQWPDSTLFYVLSSIHAAVSGLLRHATCVFSDGELAGMPSTGETPENDPSTRWHQLLKSQGSLELVVKWLTDENQSWWGCFLPRRRMLGCRPFPVGMRIK